MECSNELWENVDSYFSTRLNPNDAILEKTLKLSEEAHLPPHNVSPNQGKMLYLFAKMIGAKSVLEIGTLGGYSTIWLARALPSSGRLITLEANPKHAEVAQSNISLAGYSHLVEIHVGPALQTLPKISSMIQSFDLIFIDADKKSNSQYLQWALKLSRPGTIILADNVVREGKVIDSESEDGSVQGIRQFIDLLSQEASLESTVIQTVGSKGYDGFALARVKVKE